MSIAHFHISLRNSHVSSAPLPFSSARHSLNCRCRSSFGWCAYRVEENVDQPFGRELTCPSLGEKSDILRYGVQPVLVLFGDPSYPLAEWMVAHGLHKDGHDLNEASRVVVPGHVQTAEDRHEGTDLVVGGCRGDLRDRPGRCEGAGAFLHEGGAHHLL